MDECNNPLPAPHTTRGVSVRVPVAVSQGLTLVHFTAQLEQLQDTLMS